MISVATSCPFCSREAAPRWPEVNVWACGSCDLSFRSPAPSEAELEELYETSWREPEANRRETGGTSLELARTYCAQLARSLGRDGFAGLRILEFGAGRGAMLRAMVERGAEVCAVEPFGYDLLSSQGFNVYRTLDDLPSGFQFDGIVSIDVVEHIREPWHELRQIRDLLYGGGWVFLATLNTNGMNATIRRGKWREAQKPGHLVFFTAPSLEAIFSSSGYSRWERLKWQIVFRKDIPRRVLHYFLQAASLDGELRYLAWR